MNTEFIRLKDISKRTSLSTTTLRRMIKRNELKAVLIGGNYYVRPIDYDEFMFNIECKRLGLPPEAVKKYFKEEDDKKVKEFMNSLGLKQDENIENDPLYQSMLDMLNIKI